MDAKREFDLWAHAGGAREDVFLSYAQQDARIAKSLAEVFQQERWSVFTDDEIRSGADWRATLESKLEQAKCILVIWSERSVQSEWVREEADYGRSRGVLVAVRVDGCELPFGYRRFNVVDLSDWSSDEQRGGLAEVLSRVRTIIEGHDQLDDIDDQFTGWVSSRQKDQLTRLQQKRSQADHLSISGHDRDRDSVIDALGDQPLEAVSSIKKAYAELEAAQHAARFNIDDRVCTIHYESAAEHFKSALEIIGDANLRIARDDRSVEYFLAMERANCLTFSEKGYGSAATPLDEAISIYSQLSRDRRYTADIPVHFRLGCALLRRSGLIVSCVQYVVFERQKGSHQETT